MTNPAFGLYGHIRRNRIRSAVLLFGLFLLSYAVAYALLLIAIGHDSDAPLGEILEQTRRAFLYALPVVTVGMAAWIWIGLGANTRMIAYATGARALSRDEAPRLYDLLENLCISRGLKVPRLDIVESAARNAFASGVDESQFTITVTRGLLEALDEAELEAVLAHELTHIRNGDVRLMIVAVLIAGVASFFGEMIFRSVRHGSRRSSGSSFKFGGGSGGSGGRRSGKSGGGGAALAILIGLAILLVAWLLAIVIRMSLSRSREYLADAGSVELTKNPDAMISALLKVAGRADLDGVPSGVMDMCLENDPDDVADIFMTHPSIAKRVRALVETAGGRMPDGVLLEAAAAELAETPRGGTVGADAA